MMEKVIWKFPLTPEKVQTIELPWGAEILTVQAQGHGVCLWAKCDPMAFKRSKTIVLHPTGLEFEDYPSRYIGTFQMDGGSLVFHVFEALQ